MKIEMGESLFYSWLRHEKECQIVQTNWKVSQKWKIQHESEMDEIIDELKDYFKTLAEKNGTKYPFFDKSDRPQIIKQGECDVLGAKIHGGEIDYYAVDVAFHQNGLDYGSKAKTIGKVIEKCVRTALCLYGYFDCKSADIIFASPKIGDSKLEVLLVLIAYLNTYFTGKGFQYKFSLICNEEFGTKVIERILLISKGVFNTEDDAKEEDDDIDGEGTSDTAELFMRAYVLLNMFEEHKKKAEERARKAEEQAKKKARGSTKKAGKSTSAATASGLEAAATTGSPTTKTARGDNKKAVLAVLNGLNSKGLITSSLLSDLCDPAYAKKNFDISTFPVLVSVADFKAKGLDERRFYKDEKINIDGTDYMVCSQWVPEKIDKLKSWFDDIIKEASN